MKSPASDCAARRVVIHVTIPMNIDTCGSTPGDGLRGTDHFWIRHAPAITEKPGVCWRGLRGRCAGWQRGDYELPCSRRGGRDGTGRRHQTGQRLHRVGLEDAERPQPVTDAAMLRGGGVRDRLQPGVAGNALPDRFAQVVLRITVQRCRQRRPHRQQNDEQARRYAERASKRAKH